jgi:hypothetical protein
VLLGIDRFRDVAVMRVEREGIPEPQVRTGGIGFDTD